ncbi:MAG: hypothetical protein FWC73_09925 [Defluviitaleaceae bacterium]|nr:hypothetical protein [Defluviitaleaceae bacterium]
MKKTVRIFLLAILVGGFLLIHLPIRVHATHGFSSGVFNIYVDGQPFEVWGYGGDGPVPAFRLQDLAYILRGTSARFGIRESRTHDVDYWIIRGADYTPIGTELAPMPEERWGMFGSYGYFDWHGFDAYPIQTVIVGIDGEYEPETATALRLIRDVDYTYFPIEFFGHLLDFTWVWVWDEDGHSYYEITTGTGPDAQLPIMSPQLARLLSRLSGQWVDEAHYYSPAIDERVVWPMELNISAHGITDIVSNSVAPAGHDFPTWPQWWYPTSIRELENGLIELTVDSGSPHLSWMDMAWGAEAVEPQLDHRRFDNRRIIVDPSQELLTEIIFYVDDVPHTMTRFHLDRFASRYTVEPAEGGGISLRYIILNWYIIYEREFRIYRSTVEDEQGELIYSRWIEDRRDSLLFRFTDTTVEHGQVYFYSLIIESPWGANNVSPGSNRQMMVDVDAILGEPESEPTPVPTPEATPAPTPEPTPYPSPTPEPLIYEPTTTFPWGTVGVIAAGSFGIGGIAWLMIGKMIQRKRS